MPKPPREAEVQLKNAGEHVQKAIASLSALHVYHCDGWDVYTTEYTERQRKALRMLLDVNDVLGE